MLLSHIVFMRMMNRLPFAFVLASVLTLPLSAFQGRPLSDFVYDDSLPCSISAAASDGNDFLLVCDLWKQGTWGQIISRDAAAGPLFYIGKGGTGDSSAVWNGTSYVVSWCSEDESGTYAATVSRTGAIGEASKISNHCSVKLAANGDRVLYAGSSGPSQFVIGGLLDLQARPVSAPTLLFGDITAHHAITATNDGFALGTFGYGSTSLTRIDRDGDRRGVPIVVEGPYAPTSAYSEDGGIIASDGENVLLAFHGSRSETMNEMRTAVVAADGTIRRPAASILTMTEAGGFANRVIPASVIWNGSAYIAGFEIVRNYSKSSAAWTRIGPDGARIDEVTALGDVDARHVRLASNDRENLVALTRGPITSASVTPSYALADRNSLTPATPFLSAGRTLSAHVEIAIGAARDQYLAAWTEKHGNVWRVRASRVDRSGRYLDGTGILLGSAVHSNAPAVGSDGTNWLVVWGDSALRARRISSTGVLLDTQPIALGNGNEAAVAWANGSWMVVASSEGALVAVPVAADGVAGPRRTLAQANFGKDTEEDPTVRYTDPVVAYDGARFIAGAIHESSYFIGAIQPAWAEEQTFAMTSLDANGAAFDDPPSLVAGCSASTLALATNGSTSSLAVCPRWGKLIGVLLPSRTQIQIADHAYDRVAATWDGHDFVVTWRSAVETNTISTARVTTEGVISAPVETNFAPSESISRFALGGGNDMPPLLGFVAAHEGWNGRPRASAAFLTELTAAGAPPPPAPHAALPVPGNKLLVQWTPIAAALGISFELRTPDGTYRPLGIAASSADSVQLALDGLKGDAIRARAWNSAGTSQPSADVAIRPARQRAARK